jgi:hypothetical protein
MERIITSIFLAGGVFFLSNTSFVFCQEALPVQTAPEMSLWLSRIERERAIDSGFQLAQERVILEEMEQSRHTQFKLEEFFRRNVNPYLEIEEAYDDNIFLNPTRKKDFITTFTPGVKINLATEDSLLEIDAGAKLTSYAVHPFMNSQDPYFRLAWDKYFNRYHLNLKEHFKKDMELRSDFIAGAEGKERYLFNDFNFIFGAEYNRLAFDLGARRYDYFYDKEFKKENNYNENIFSLTGYTNLAPKTRLLFEYDHGIILYPEHPFPSRNCRYDEGWVGLKGDITPKIIGIAKVGYQYRVYRARADWDQPIASIDLVYNFKERTSFSLKVEDNAEQSLSESENYYELMKVDIGMNHRFAFNPKLGLGIGGFYEDDDYPASSGTKRNDKIYSLRGLFRYDLQRWLFASLGYTFTERDSNLDENDYVDHIFSLKLKGSF